MAVEVQAPAGARAARMEFASPPGERFYGFGERSDAVERSGRETESYVSDGPVRPEDYRYVKASVPPWADRERSDSTYFPVPWLLSSRGYGVWIEEDVTSRFDTAGARRWAADGRRARLRLRVFAGPDARRCPAALHRGGGPPARAPGAVDVRALVPDRPAERGPGGGGAGDHPRPARVPAPRCRWPRPRCTTCRAALTRGARRPSGSAPTRSTATAWRGSCTSTRCCARRIRRSFGRARRGGVLQRGPGGTPFLYPAFVGGSGPAGFTQEPLAQFDFTHPATEGFYAGLVRRPWTAAPTAGWRTSASARRPPPSSSTTAARGTPRTTATRPTTTAPCSGSRARFGRAAGALPALRAGPARRAAPRWCGAATRRTVWGFDGISSAVTQVLSIGHERRGALGHRHRRLRVLRRRSRASRAPPRTRG